MWSWGLWCVPLVRPLFFLSVSDPVPQISKTSTTPLEADQSIDEILGLEVLYCVQPVFFDLCFFPRAVTDALGYREKST